MIKVGDSLPATTLMEFVEVAGEGCSIGPNAVDVAKSSACLLYTSPSPRDRQKSRMPSSA